ncbi:CDP-diacylglycerol--serine O-phosphatidyltransferase [Rhodospirillum rubrum]|uniref:CDP-diacylglycerol--serine O-phosphatidyltransferase n=1 Tax=Rhodospirillum rubrum (strain ATCC 11170 / ATH 1.1.1 / DSM 467 / LMG 4362 / NCIMB 8255 / S1) TaxID=269796 RepID=Q2RNB7_RHORT|nr:CDP-diacylglycerol--serine O-phosphatidyltransferase [Rhodospirillum rubrum]ABC24378.1 CDP-diacylglycerol--serine O-phosphatidyltransferase [Rhodospirillum rubrum ATCC 11170]AEO50129.1 CDP-diacylglycerol--serine O-phosphatidyltransferase [Rhodospirillum rubrum F11]MBK1664208.1 CDP-diacylglycerol--serine O-phosphatidyltransferase [Rhodospirillum rubrum]MBK1676434.1 CDP-diacylglycerol--serine O-phosphatidyltransferase [Rhodospirillum rubrum]MBK5956100.1 CDP-diacylglycerol--serine O-phosphatid
MVRHPHVLRRSTPRFQGMPFNKMVPNMLTLLALCAGLTSIRYGLHGEYQKAVVALVFSAIFDGLDGRVARLLKGTSQFGAELDSLSDFVCFGVAPAMLLYLWTMSGAGGIGWALVLLYVVCCGLRLARFNTQLMGEKDLPSWAYNYFTGVPAPAAAGLVLLPMILSFESGADFLVSPVVAGVFLVGVAALMVSKLPTFSFKKAKIPHVYVLPLMLAIGVLAAFLVTNPWLTLGGLGLFYLALLPFGLRSFRKLQREAQQVTGEIAEETVGAPPEP